MDGLPSDHCNAINASNSVHSIVCRPSTMRQDRHPGRLAGGAAHASPQSRRLSLDDEPEIHQAVMQVLRATIEYGRPTVYVVADALEMSVRTLQRRLADFDLTFNAMLEQFRQERAVELLIHGAHSITAVAFLLGYSDSAHFSRAFRRWFDQSPRHFVIAVTDSRYLPFRHAVDLTQGLPAHEIISFSVQGLSLNGKPGTELRVLNINSNKSGGSYNNACR